MMISKTPITGDPIIGIAEIEMDEGTQQVLILIDSWGGSEESLVSSLNHIVEHGWEKYWEEPENYYPLNPERVVQWGPYWQRPYTLLNYRLDTRRAGMLSNGFWTAVPSM